MRSADPNLPQLRRIAQALGDLRDAGSDVICRWIHEALGLLFDLMPVQPEVLGFSNRWYPCVMETAEPGLIAEPERADLVMDRLRKLSR